MQIKTLFKQFDKLQRIHGDKNLYAVYGAGEIHNPQICLIFMNPTGKNISSSKQWTGLKAPWISTKNIWKMFFQLGLFKEDFYNKIKTKKPEDWCYKFADEVYKKVKDNSIYITNLAKATQTDARPLKNEVFREYLNLLKKEINIINPQIIITFGNQVSSIILNKNIKISDYRKKHENLKIGNKNYKIFPVYYPVGQGMRNMPMAKEDIAWIINNSRPNAETHPQAYQFELHTH